MMQEEKLDKKKRDRDESNDEEKFGEKKLPPNIRFGDPPLTIADESFALDDTEDKEHPRKYQKETDEPVSDEEEERIFIVWGQSLRVEFNARVKSKKS
jgi:hypothetical protein